LIWIKKRLILSAVLFATRFFVAFATRFQIKQVK